RKTRNVPVIRWMNHWKALERAVAPYLLAMGMGAGPLAPRGASPEARGGGYAPKWLTRAAMEG
ncbi:MAG: hypothetical protein AAFQ43_10350, partial [Bacteroidota bacterium]